MCWAKPGMRRPKAASRLARFSVSPALAPIWGSRAERAMLLSCWLCATPRLASITRGFCFSARCTASRRGSFRGGGALGSRAERAMLLSCWLCATPRLASITRGFCFSASCTASRRVSLRGAGSWANALAASASSIGILSFMVHGNAPGVPWIGRQVVGFTLIIVSRICRAAHILASANIAAPRSANLRRVVGYTHTMSKRLQVLLADDEMSDIRILAQRERLTVGEWVRRVLREARAQKSVKDPAFKLEAIRRAVERSEE